jgi:hypothetical protein
MVKRYSRCTGLIRGRSTWYTPTTPAAGDLPNQDLAALTERWDRWLNRRCRTAHPTRDRDS